MGCSMRREQVIDDVRMGVRPVESDTCCFKARLERGIQPGVRRESADEEHHLSREV